MIQIDMFEDKMFFPNDIKENVAGICRAAPDGYNILVDPPKKKIYESPDKGETIYERDFGADPSTRRIIKTAVQQQWKIVYRGTAVDPTEIRLL